MNVDDFEVLLQQLLRENGSTTSSEVAVAASVSRQVAHRLLKRAVEAGRLVPEGKARATRYREPGTHLVWARAGLEEDRAWAAVVDRSPGLDRCGDECRRIARYAFTEMVNNAIDHSGATRISARLEVAAGRASFVIEDDGVGAFAHVRDRAGLVDELQALQEVSKGRFTTDPANHTGEGLFFTSKAVSRFELRAGGLAWIVDQKLDDVAVLEVEPRVGTQVSFVVDDPPLRSLADLFAEYTIDFEFARTRTVVKLFEYGREFVSRSEAKRLLAGLERFREVLVDFHGVDGVGQGFADEVFRVWPSTHPGVQLLPVNMNRVVAMMVGRARPRG